MPRGANRGTAAVADDEGFIDTDAMEDGPDQGGFIDDTYTDPESGVFSHTGEPNPLGDAQYTGSATIGEPAEGDGLDTDGFGSPEENSNPEANENAKKKKSRKAYAPHLPRPSVGSLEFMDDLPSGSTPAPRRSPVREISDALRANPGKWIEITWLNDPSTGASQIRAGAGAWERKGDFEVEARLTEDGSRKFFTRYIGEGTDSGPASSEDADTEEAESAS
jgi:hypothetical protein